MFFDDLAFLISEAVLLKGSMIYKELSYFPQGGTPQDSLSKWIYAPELWDVKYFMASAGDVMAGTVLTNDPRCSRCQPEIGGAARKTTRDARYDSRGKLSQRRGTDGWNVSLLQYLLFSITTPLMWRIWRPNNARLGPQFQLVNQWWLIDYSELNLQSVTLPISREKFMMIWSTYDFWIKKKNTIKDGGSTAL